MVNISIVDDQFLQLVQARLEKLNFEIHYTNKLKNIRGYGHLSSITVFNDKQNRRRGGHIYIYDRYPEEVKRELLLHEFVHICDEYTPIYSTSSKDLNNGYMLSKEQLKSVELRTEIASLLLMMPVEQFQRNLFSNSYNIANFIKIYKAIEISTVIRWLILNDYFHAHFAVIYFFKAQDDMHYSVKIDEYCRDNYMFDINNILSNPTSIAFKSSKGKKHENGFSIVNNKEYMCFCFYQRGIEQSLPASVTNSETIVTCDEMVVVGWSKDTYKYIQKLDFKAS